MECSFQITSKGKTDRFFRVKRSGSLAVDAQGIDYEARMVQLGPWQRFVRRRGHEVASSTPEPAGTGLGTPRRSWRRWRREISVLRELEPDRRNSSSPVRDLSRPAGDSFSGPRDRSPRPEKEFSVRKGLSRSPGKQGPIDQDLSPGPQDPFSGRRDLSPGRQDITPAAH
jgi:hypothetical protein